MPGEGIRILFAGGGTGGHIFPGVALSQASPGSSFWLCTTRPFDSTHLAKAGIPFEPLESPRWHGFRGFLGPMARSILAAARRIRDFRPDLVVGVGGYGTVPPVLAARALGLPYVLLEQNARPGRANRLLAAGAERIYVQWAEAKPHFPGSGSRVVVTGSPLRAQLKRIPRGEALRRFGFPDALPTLAVVGGSQGAEILNRGVPGSLDGTAPKLQIIHVAGAGHAEAVRADYATRGATAAVVDFVSDMDTLYSAADLLISRAGAMAIAEIAALEVPAVLVPIARSSGDHQRENARALARAGGAILVEERECAAGALTEILRRLARRDPSLARMGPRLRPFSRPGAARAILEDLRKAVCR
jgi:UDP-N-acetylglucosamine--N-acetylmuramyl-(pentapeptide) pyrophosphoryl-undecaprenol N-acetylglucosamine transferase